MRNLNELNMNDRGERVTTPPPSPTLIARFQQHFGVTLPLSYVDLLSLSNGGQPELGDCVAEERGYPVDIDHFFSLTEDEGKWSGVWRRTTFLRSILAKDTLVAVAVDGTGDIIFLDLTQGKEDVKILFRPDGNSIVKIASSFEKFVDSLYKDPDSD